MVQANDLGHGPPVAIALRDPEVHVGMGCDLGQVRHDEDLVTPRECPEAPADRVRAPTADPRVDLVEDERRRGVGFGNDLLDGQGDPRELAARRDLRQRAGRFARVGGKPEHHVVGTRGIEGHRVTLQLDRGLVGRCGPAAELDLERALGKSEASQDDIDLALDAGRDRSPEQPELPGGVRDVAEEGRVVREPTIPLPLHPVEALDLRLGPFPMGDDRGFIVAVAALETEDDGQALLESGDGRRIVIDGLERRPDVSGQVLQLGVRPRQARRNGLEARVEPGQAASLLKRGADQGPCGCAVTAAVATAVERFADGGSTAGDRGAVSRRGQPSANLLGLSDPQPRGGNLCRLVAEQLEASSHLSRIRHERRERCAILAPAGDGAGHGRAGLTVPAVGIEKVALPAFVEESTLIVLAVNLHQRPDGLDQASGRHRDVVEPSRRSPAGRDLSRHDQRLRHAIEERFDAGQVGAVPDEGRVGARPEGEAERVDHEALAGPGLAGQDVEAGLEPQAQAVNEAQVDDRQLEETAHAVADLGRGVPAGFGRNG